MESYCLEFWDNPIPRWTGMSMKKKSTSAIPNRREDDHQEDNFREDNHREQRNRRANCHRDWCEDVGDLSRIVPELERRCMFMEMKMKDKSKSIVVEKLLLDTSSLFTRRVANYRLPKKFEVPQILSYAWDGDPLNHLENFWGRKKWQAGSVFGKAKELAKE